MQNSCYAQIVSSMLRLFLIYQWPRKIFCLFENKHLSRADSVLDSQQYSEGLAWAHGPSLLCFHERDMPGTCQRRASDGQVGSQVEHAESSVPPNSEIPQHAILRDFQSSYLLFSRSYWRVPVSKTRKYTKKEHRKWEMVCGRGDPWGQQTGPKGPRSDGPGQVEAGWWSRDSTWGLRPCGILLAKCLGWNLYSVLRKLSRWKD